MKSTKIIIMASIISALCFGSYQIANADAGLSLNITRLIVNSDGTVLFSTDVQPSNTCSYYGIFYTFNSNSLPGGKQMLSAILTAKVSNQKMDIWYNNATYPGTNDTNGCLPGNLASVTGVSIN